MLQQNKYLAGAGALTALGTIAPLWVAVEGDLLGAAIIAIPSALVLAIGFGVAWTFKGRIDPKLAGALGRAMSAAEMQPPHRGGQVKREPIV